MRAHGPSRAQRGDAAYLDEAAHTHDGIHRLRQGEESAHVDIEFNVDIDADNTTAEQTHAEQAGQRRSVDAILTSKKK